jgi:hypothetical protein
MVAVLQKSHPPGQDDFQADISRPEWIGTAEAPSSALRGARHVFA